jgi:fatty acid desaturase
MTGKIEWYRTPLDRKLLQELTQASDVRGFLQAGGFLLIYLCTASAACYFFLQQQWIPMAIAAYVHCMFHGFVGMEAAVHELSHGTPFKTKRVSEFFYRLFCFLTWNNYVHFRASHMKHHQFTVHRGLDKEVILEPIALNAWTYLQWFTFNAGKFKMIMLPNVAHFFGNADRDVFFWDPLFPAGDHRRKEMCNWARFMFIGHILLLAAFVYFKLWVLIGLVTFGYFIANFPSQSCGIQQHLGLRPNVPDWRVCCHTVSFSPLMAFLYWQMNFHMEHHMYAAVPFWNLRRLHAAIAFDAPPPPGSYLAGIRRILWIQRQQKRDPSFCFLPDFPQTASPPKLTSMQAQA